LDEFGPGGALLDLDPAFGIDIDVNEDVGIEGGLYIADSGSFVGLSDGVVDAAMVGGGERLSEVDERFFELPHLLRERLERDGGSVGVDVLLRESRRAEKYTGEEFHGPSCYGGSISGEYLRQMMFQMIDVARHHLAEADRLIAADRARHSQCRL